MLVAVGSRDGERVPFSGHILCIPHVGSVNIIYFFLTNNTIRDKIKDA